VPQGPSGHVRKISPTPGFDLRTVRPVTSRYTDCAIRATVDDKLSGYFVFSCDRSIIRNTLFGEQSTFRLYLPLEGIHLNYVACSLHACVKNDVNLAPIHHEIRTFYSGNRIHFRLYLVFHWREFFVFDKLSGYYMYHQV
jgi:hypothetical protein